MNKRLKQLRKYLNLSQEEFGGRLGVTRASISRLESGDINFTERMIKSICREFNVSPLWLTDGIGEMLLSIPDDLLVEIAEEYNLDDFDIKLIREFLKLNSDQRAAIKLYIKNIQAAD